MRLSKVLVASLVVAVWTTGCNHASGFWSSLVGQIEQGLESGALLSTLEGIVATFFPQYAKNLAQIDAILQAIVTALMEAGVLPPAGQQAGRAVLEQIRAKPGPKPLPPTSLDAPTRARLERAIAQALSQGPRS
jgi:hypothetical protein